ncbi:VOC family protein [Streptomyces broussonetiae]|uniref:VOC family protein n=2 Tax=Streptomyces broussonetiae TaxID=2686304 RepID=A0A6I6MQ30_9ACTN|nr:VOC family protein [Streptomyces broussonetiae]QHA02578.1 VOC family protein [Streptomyces broussonetiae]
MEMTSYKPGTPSWVDLGSPRTDQAVTFYTALFGWQAEEAEPGAGGYRIMTLRGKPVAGIGPQTQPGRPRWSTYIATADAAATATAVQAAGGQTLLPPMQVMDAGTTAVFADPSGAAFGVWQEGKHHGAGIVNEPGSFCWNELLTHTPDTAVPFYREVFGWDAKKIPMGETTYTEWDLDGREVGGMVNMDEQNFPPQMPPIWMVYFAVDDTEETVGKVTALGGSVLVPPTDLPVGRFAVVADLHGAVFQVIKLTRQS